MEQMEGRQRHGGNFKVEKLEAKGQSKQFYEAGTEFQEAFSKIEIILLRAPILRLSCDHGLGLAAVGIVVHCCDRRRFTCGKQISSPPIQFSTGYSLWLFDHPSRRFPASDNLPGPQRGAA
jgi:hypothetical protein